MKIVRCENPDDLEGFQMADHTEASQEVFEAFDEELKAHGMEVEMVDSDDSGDAYFFRVIRRRPVGREQKRSK